VSDDYICNCVLLQVTLRWPTALAINPLNDELHILDDNVILKVTRDRKVVIVAGHPSYCSSTNTSFDSATESRIESAQNFAFSPDGELFLVESNARDINRIRMVDSAGRLRHYIGSQCDCYRRVNCRCNISALSTPSAVAVTPDGIVHIADTSVACVHSTVTAEPVPDRSGQFEVVHGPSHEVYVFNRYGQHLATRDLNTGLLLYNFTYNGYSHYGRLLRVADAGGHTLTIRRDYKMVARDITVCY
jgi:teneurin